MRVSGNVWLGLDGGRQARKMGKTEKRVLPGGCGNGNEDHDAYVFHLPRIACL